MGEEDLEEVPVLLAGQLLVLANHRSPLWSRDLGPPITAHLVRGEGDAQPDLAAVLLPPRVGLLQAPPPAHPAAPIRGEHCGHVTRSPPMASHLAGRFFMGISTLPSSSWLIFPAVACSVSLMNFRSPRPSFTWPHQSEVSAGSRD